MRGNRYTDYINLKDSLLFEKNPEEILKKDWDKMNRMVCGIIRSCLTQNLKYHMMTEIFTKKIWEILERKNLTKSIENHLQLKRRLYRFWLKKRISIGEHMNNCTKLLAHLANVNKVIKEECRG